MWDLKFILQDKIPCAPEGAGDYSGLVYSPIWLLQSDHVSQKDE